MHVIVRVRTGDGEPLVLEENYLPERLLPGLLAEDLSGSLYALVRERYGLSVARTRQELEPTPLDSGAAALLGYQSRRAGAQGHAHRLGRGGVRDRVRQGPPPRGPNDLRLRHLGPEGGSHPLIPALVSPLPWYGRV